MKKTKKFTLSILPEVFGICHLNKNSNLPSWAMSGNFCSIAKTIDELSIICPEDKIPGGVLVERGWKAFKVKGPLSFTATGIVAGFSTALAKAKISIFYVSTYETDYILVGKKDLVKSKKILSKFCDIK